MAAPSYTTDLADVNTAESATGWAELSGHTSGSAPATDTEQYLQNATCISQATGQATGTTSGVEYDYGSNLTFATGDCAFFWVKFSAGNNIDTWANGGVRLGIGSSSGNMDFWNAMGKDFGNYPYGGYQNTAVDPTYTADATDGTPAGTYALFGINPNMLNKITKGSPTAVDVIRYGRGELIVEFGDISNGYAVFSGIAGKNDANDVTDGYNRWGLFQSVGGTNYLWKGLISLGTATNACDFRDSNISITIDDTPRTYAAFNRIEVNNASSRIDWTAVSISALGTLAKGEFEAIANADINKDTCVFTDMSTFVYQSNSTILNSTWRRCGQVSQVGATITNCIFDESAATVALLVSALNSVTDCIFNSDGTGHGVNLGTIGSTQSLNWNNDDVGYTAASSGNETILVSVSSGFTLTINVGGGYSTPSVYNTGLGTVSVVAGQVTTKVIVKHSDGTLLITEDANVILEAAAGGPLAVGTDIINGFTDTNGEIQDIRSLASDQPVTGWVRKSTASPFYRQSDLQGTIDNATGLTLIAQLIDDE